MVVGITDVDIWIVNYTFYISFLHRFAGCCLWIIDVGFLNDLVHLDGCWEEQDHEPVDQERYICSDRGGVVNILDCAGRMSDDFFLHIKNCTDQYQQSVIDVDWVKEGF